MNRKREIKQTCERFGCDAEIENASAHIKVILRYKGHKTVLFASRTPSDVRTSKNFQADIKRWVRSIDNHSS